ncbi:hypothetical protein FEM48_Zijuj01G0141800 [Ziziphus jujuba var. spinosa]|uniref:Uncharacterized protein n=1 Tax=Ziziphus jujuba var. spinosa TaxID=714518 RepID=A0A978W1Q9_ZIZJJ|nr:hypothetical protein FEM48_Zijuj01G0141800 [Ziziphus jujuba var. spinosa]
MNIIFKEFNQTYSIGPNILLCGCLYHHTYGLPYAHKIAEYKCEGRPIHFSCVDSRWKKLDLMVPPKDMASNVSCTTEVNMFVHMFNETDTIGKLHLLRRLKEILNPSCTSPSEPDVKITSRDVQDVATDGNCGFRDIAELMNMGDNKLDQIRRELIDELKSNKDEYTALHGTSDRIEELNYIVSYFESNPKPLHVDCRKVIFIGFVNDNHFVKLFMVPKCPIPPVADKWFKHHQICAQGWETEYSLQIKAFKGLISDDIAI